MQLTCNIQMSKTIRYDVHEGGWEAGQVVVGQINTIKVGMNYLYGPTLNFQLLHGTA